MAKYLIETITLDSSASSITFSNIPQDYTDLMIKVSSRSTRNAGADFLELLPNASTSVTALRLQGDGAAVASDSLTGGRVANMPAASTTSNTFGNFEIYFSNYTNSSNKSASINAVSEDNATTAYQTLVAFIYNNTSAITSIRMEGQLGSLDAGSTFSLYGFLAGNDGSTTVS